MEQTEVVDLVRRVAELEASVRTLSVIVGVLAAVILTAAFVAWMWLRSRHAEVIAGLGDIARGQEELREEVRAAELARASRHEGVVVH